MTPTVRSVAQGRTTSGTAVSTGVFPVSPVTGDTIVVFVANYLGGTHAPVVDTQGNSYTKLGTTIVSASDSNMEISMWHSRGITGGSSFTVTGGLASAGVLTVIAYCLVGPAVYAGDWKGASQTNPATTTDAVTTGTTAVTPPLTALAIAGMSTSGADNDISNGTGWTRPTNGAYGDNTGNFACLYTEYKTTATTYAAVWTAAHINLLNVLVTASFIGSNDATLTKQLEALTVSASGTVGSSDNTGTLVATLAPLTLAGGMSDAGRMTVTFIDVTGYTSGTYPYPVSPLRPIIDNILIQVYPNEPMVQVTAGTPSLTLVSSDPARHPDIVLNYAAIYSDLALGSTQWNKGKSVLGFIETVDLSTCAGMTFTLGPTTPKTNWDHYTSVDGDPLPTDLAGRTIPIAVGPGVYGTLTQTLAPLTVSSRGTASRYGTTVALDGAAGYWPLDDPPGTLTARDVIGTRPGTLVGGVVAGIVGLFGRAMAFYGAGGAGTPGYINLGAGPPALATAFSIDLWCLPWTNAANHAFVSKSPVGSNPAPTPGYFSFHMLGPLPPPAGRLVVAANDPITATAISIDTLGLSAWHHVAMTYTPGATPTVRLYLDGVLDGSGTVPMGEDAGSLVTYIGDQPWDPLTGRGWDGLLQAVAWYPSALSDVQIAAHRQVGLALAGRRLPFSLLALLGDDDMLRYNIATPITTSDTVALSRPTDAIYVGVTGDIVVVLQNGQARTFTDVSAGSILPVVASRVNATNTTAGSLLALYTQ